MGDMLLADFIDLLTEDDDGFEAPFQIPPPLVLPFEVPAGLGALAANNRLGRKYTRMGEYANLAMQVVEEDYRRGVMNLSPYDEAFVHKGNVNAQGYVAADIIYRVIMAGREVFPMPADLRDVLGFLDIAWPADDTDVAVRTVVNSVLAVRL